MQGPSSIPGRLSRSTTPPWTFDVETDAQFAEGEVRTFVFEGGRVVDRVVWSAGERDAECLRGWVELQHAAVLARIEERGARWPADRLIGSLPPPAESASSPVSAPPSAESPHQEEPMSEGSRIDRALAASPVVVQAAVVDEEGGTVASHARSDAAPELDAWLAETAFLSTGLEALARGFLDVGAFVGAQVERGAQQVLIVHAAGLACAFVPAPRVPVVRALDAVRVILESDGAPS